MSEILNIEELDDLSPESLVVELPALTAKLGKPANVRIQRIGPIDLLKMYNVPMDEINALAIAGDNVAEKTGELLEEQVQAFDVDDYKRLVVGVNTHGLVEPEPTDDALRKMGLDGLGQDAMYLFSAIMEFTNPKEDAEAAARFRKDG